MGVVEALITLIVFGIQIAFWFFVIVFVLWVIAAIVD